MSTTSTTSLDPLFTFISQTYAVFETNFFKLPGSSVVARYVKSSHQNDPGRTLLELILVVILVYTILQSRTRADQSGKHFIEFDEKVCLPRLCVRTVPPSVSDAQRSLGN